MNVKIIEHVKQKVRTDSEYIISTESPKSRPEVSETGHLQLLW